MAITAMTPGADVPAPEPIGRRYGLFDAASGPLDLPRQGEGGGVRFVPVGCGEAFAYGVACYTSSDEPADKPLDGDNPLVETGVFAAVSTLLCSAVGYSLGEMQAKIRRRLEGGEQAAVEAALWTGLNMDGDDLGTPSLSGEAEAVQTGYNPELITDVLGALVEVAAFAAEAGLVLPEGPRKVTPMGSIWVFGAYPSGEVIVTGQTTVWRAPSIEVYDSFENATNQRLLVAERAYSVAFECFAGRAEFDPLEVTSP
jgi:hypothetical protein